MLFMTSLALFCSFITFPQIIFDGFQADTNKIEANQSLPAFELVDILTADVSI